MNIIAIDVSKDTLDILFGPNPDASNYEKIENTPESLKLFLKKHNFNPQKWFIILESTGDYSRTPAIFFLNNKFQVKLLNPILTQQFTRTTIRKIKTDKTDTEKIMKLALAGEGDALSLKDLNNPSKELLRLSHFLVKLRTQLKLKLQSVQRKKLAGEEIEEEMLNLIDQMTEIVKNLDGKALEEKNEQVEFIDSIPGFSEKLSHVVVTELGDITNFKNANALVAYAGLDPKINQSGSSLNGHGRITKRGSSVLRYSLFLAARIAWRYDADLYEYYEKKRAEGRSFTEVMCMISRKLLHRIFIVVKEKRPYEIRKTSS